MTLFDLARAGHVVAVAHWIGGLAFVSLVVLPSALRTGDPDARLKQFEETERRFSAQARISVPFAGLTGFYLLAAAGGLDRLTQTWWLIAMTVVWAVFMLFVAEPLFLHAWFRRRARADSDRLFHWALRLHLVLLIASAIVIGAGVLGAHGAIRQVIS